MTESASAYHKQLEEQERHRASAKKRRLQDRVITVLWLVASLAVFFFLYSDKSVHASAKTDLWEVGTLAFISALIGGALNIPVLFGFHFYWKFDDMMRRKK